MGVMPRTRPWFKRDAPRSSAGGTRRRALYTEYYDEEGEAFFREYYDLVEDP